MTPASSPAINAISGAPRAAFARVAGWALAVMALLLAGVVGLYLIKSALGINVFAGHSPLLHAKLYPLVRG
jgi:hypothetical protein